MPFRRQPQSYAMPDLTAGEWHAVQRAVRAVEHSGCARGEQPGPWHRSLARIGQLVRPRRDAGVAPELEPLRDFLCTSARHGPGLDALAERLESQGYTPAQIAALTFIAG